MKFKFLLEDLLNEATPEEIYKKYYSDIDANAFVKLISYDPQTVIDNRKIMRIGKYAKMIINMYRLKNLKWEDMDLVKDYLTLVYHHKVPLDINKIRSIPDLYDVVKMYEVKDKRSLQSILVALPKDSYKIVLNTDKWIMLTPLKEIAACYLGVNAQWCTTWGPHSLDPSNKDKQNRFSSYGEGQDYGQLFIIIDKKDENHKYQFQFRAKEFMDANNRPINSGEFFDNNPEIKYYFFPSLREGSSEPASDEEIGKIRALSAADAATLLTSRLTDDDKANPLVKAIVDEDVDLLNQLIVDDVMDGEIEIDSSVIIFDLDNYGGGDLALLDSILSHYNDNSQNAASNLYDELSGDNYYFKEDDAALRFFKEYFQKNFDMLNDNLRIRNYENFEKMYFEGFSEDRDLFYAFIDQMSDLSAADYQAAYRDLAEDIERYIDYGYRGTVSVSIAEFIKFLLEKEITVIDNIIDVLEDYIDYCGIYVEYDYAEYDRIEPTYEQMEDKINDHFDNVIRMYGSGENCIALRDKLFEILDKFKFNDSNSFENEFITIRADLGSLNCENESVEIILRNKKTGSVESGAVKIDNLPNYLNNYSLFEYHIKFKKNIQ